MIYAPRSAFNMRCLSYAMLLGAMLVVPGCNGGSKNSGPSGNVLRYALQTAPTQLDPARVEDGDTIDLLQNMFESLVQWSVQNEPVPNLAEKWDLSADGRVYTFHLKPNVKFHNGRVMTAKDVEYSLTRALAPATKSGTAKAYLDDIVGAKKLLDGKATTLEGVKVIDDNTISITLDYARAYFLGKLTFPTAYVVCKEEIEKNGGRFDEKCMIGTGPFKLAEYKSGYMVKLAVNKDYHGQKPLLDGIERPIKTETIARQTAYEAGELDFTDLQRGDIDRIQKDPVLSKEMKTFPRANIYYLAMNQLVYPPFKDKRVRLAFAYAINKQDMLRIALRDMAVIAKGPVPPGVPGYDKDYVGIPFDPKKGQELLAQAGFPGGKGLPRLTVTYRQGWQHIADGVQRIRDDLKKNLGVEVDTKQIEWTQFLKERSNATMPCFHLRWAADYLDQQDFLSMMLRTGAEENKVGYSNPTFDSLCDQADVEKDPVKRKDLYRKAERIAVEDAAWVMLYHLPDVELHKPTVSGLRDCMMGHLPHVTTKITR